MPWQEVSVIDARLRFVRDVQRGVFSMAELCRRHRISRPVAYKWLARFEAAGTPGLADHSRRPLSCPHATDRELITALCELRRHRPHWGAKKLLVKLQRLQPDWKLPHPATAHAILKREGLIPGPPRRTRRPHPGRPTSAMTDPNDVWTIDYKGQFKTRDGQYCYPLTVQDGATRFLLGCQGLLHPSIALTRPVLERLFRDYGLPERIRSDNGTPFAANTLGRLSTLAVWWVRLGIRPELIEPGRPQQNGRHERMHRTLKHEAARPAEATLRAQQRRFDQFRFEYNYDRPHEALGQRTPVSLYSASPRSYPRRLPLLEYPPHFEVRKVSANGGIRWHAHRVPVSHLLIDEYIGFEEIDDGLWTVYFGMITLGWFHEHDGQIEDHQGRRYRHTRC
jgi:transposase InsO family protein